MKNRFFRLIPLIAIGFFLSSCYHNTPKQYDGWKLVWNDEFNTDGSIDNKFWNIEERPMYDSKGEYYLKTNVFCRDGSLIIEGTKHYSNLPQPGIKNCCSMDDDHDAAYYFTSINTCKKMEFIYGRIEICAKIPNNTGAWPAVWTLGTDEPWESTGEIGLLQYYIVNPEEYRQQAASEDNSNNGPYTTIKNSVPIPLKAFTKVTPKWINRFHIWRIDWNAESIGFYLDNRLINKIFLSKTITNNVSHNINNLQCPHFILFNLSRISDEGNVEGETTKPHYEIDYIRVYQREMKSQ